MLDFENICRCFTNLDIGLILVAIFIIHFDCSLFGRAIEINFLKILKSCKSNVMCLVYTWIVVKVEMWDTTLEMIICTRLDCLRGRPGQSLKESAEMLKITCFVLFILVLLVSQHEETKSCVLCCFLDVNFCKNKQSD